MADRRRRPDPAGAAARARSRTRGSRASPPALETAPSTPAALGAQLGPRRPDAVPLRGARAADDGHAVPDAADDAGVVPRLCPAPAARGVVGLGFGTEVVRAGIPPLLADACGSQRIPLFEVPYRTPFIAVARANAEAIAAAGLRAPQLGAGGTARDLARGAAPGRTRRDPRRARPPARHVGRPCTTPPGRSRASIRPPARADDGRGAARARSSAVLRRGARAASSLRIGEHAVHAADARPRRAPSRRDRDRRRGSGPGGPRRRHRRHRDGRARPRAAAGPRPRARRCCARDSCSRCCSDDPALARRIARELWGGAPGRAGPRGGDGCRSRAQRRRAASCSSCAPTSGAARCSSVAATTASCSSSGDDRRRRARRVRRALRRAHRGVGPDRLRRLRGRRSIRRGWPATGARAPVTHFADVARAGVLSVPPSAEARTSPRPSSPRSCDTTPRRAPHLLETRAGVAGRTTARTRHPPAPSASTVTPCAPGSRRPSGCSTATSARSPTRAELWAALRLTS